MDGINAFDLEPGQVLRDRKGDRWQVHQVDSVFDTEKKRKTLNIYLRWTRPRLVGSSACDRPFREKMIAFDPDLAVLLTGYELLNQGEF